jgi:hypothetical protein
MKAINQDDDVTAVTSLDKLLNAAANNGNS